MPGLKSDPDWIGAARAFVAGLEAQPGLDGRVAFIDACRAELGEQVYPAFIKLLAAVAAFGDEAARALCAEALAHALATARLPSARVAAFGGDSRPPAFALKGLATHVRAVGPIEFLCLWLTRDVADEPLEPEAFRAALAWLLTLFDSAPRAAALYRAKLLADADNPMEGLHSQDSRQRVRALAAAWESGADAAEIAARAAAAAPAARRDPFAGLAR